MSDPVAAGGSYEVRPPLPAQVAESARVHVRIWREAYAAVMSAETLAGLDPTRREALYSAAAHDELPDGTTMLVAVHRPTEAVVGMINVGPGRDASRPVQTELRAINVLAAHHGTGVAQQLLDAALGDRSAYLWVVAGNERAQAFYRRNGFVLDGARKRDGDLEVDELRMVRR